jgi:signal transduction histidine kinase
MTTWRDRVRPTRLFWRVLFYGLLMVGATATTVGLVTRFLHEPPPFFDLPIRYARVLEPSCADRAGLQRRLDELSSVLGDSFAIFSATGERLAASGPGASRLVPLERAPLAVEHVPSGDDRGPMILASPMTCAGPGDYLLVSPPPRPPHGSLLVPTLIITLAFLSVGIFLLARTLTRPLERITASVRAFGRGDLDARAGVQGRDEIANLAQAFDEMAERLQATVRRERELLANVSHEIRTPLARVAVALDLCSDDGVGVDEIQRQLGGIRGDLDELNRLLEDVLTTARLDLASDPGAHGAVRVQRLGVAVDELVARAVGRFEQLHPDREVRVDVPAAPVMLQGDPVLLRRVLDNLLENAARYSPAATPIDLAATLVDGRVALEVADRGQGVEPDELLHLFEPFFRSERARAVHAGGLGLGLTLCRRVVEAHGGTVTARRRDGGGLAVRFELPIA